MTFPSALQLPAFCPPTTGLTLEPHCWQVTHAEAKAYFGAGLDDFCRRSDRGASHVAGMHYSGRCFQAFQRFATLDLALRHAHEDDLVRHDLMT